MLIGVGGSGKQSLAKLAVYMAGLTPVSIVISKSYSLNDFKADLQVRRGGPAKIPLLVPYFQKTAFPKRGGDRCRAKGVNVSPFVVAFLRLQSYS